MASNVSSTYPKDNYVYSKTGDGNEHDSITTLSKVQVIDMIIQFSNCSNEDANLIYIKICDANISVDKFLTFLIININEKTFDMTKILSF